MAQRDFEKFKQEIKSWMEAHPDKYDAFVEEVNGPLHPRCDGVLGQNCE